MADYTDIDKLRELAEAATPGPWYCALSDRVQGVAEHTDEVGGQTYVFQDFICVTDSGMEEEPDQDADEANAAYIAAASPDVILALAAELVGLRTEVDQLRGDNERLRESVMAEWESCSFDSPLPAGSWPDVALQLIRQLLGRRDALQAKLEGADVAFAAAVELGQELTDQVAALQARIDALEAEREADGA